MEISRPTVTFLHEAICEWQVQGFLLSTLQSGDKGGLSHHP